MHDLKARRTKEVIEKLDAWESGLTELGPGEVFGEMSLLSKDPASASVTASIDSTLGVLPRIAFDEFVIDHPALRARLEARAAERRAHNERFLPEEMSSAVLV